ncbi:DUF1071 domain-containing protein [Staphylococcus saprophyticus]|nr:DUF1071 domain-containing protein [Staphylococcus saprophyticus]MDW4426285.1 DUF1071 domain-containing protein [Staphylococcus saprophyticus]
MNFIEHFNELNSRNVNDNVEKKNGLNYLSWAYVQQELTKLDENFQHRFIEFPSTDSDREDIFLPYLKTEEGYMVCVEITLFGVTKREWLPVLNYKNQAIPKGSATTFDINKSMKRVFVKCAAQFGLGNYLYLGEDAPDESENLRQELMNEIQRFTDLLTVKGTEITPDEVKQKFQIGDISKLSQSDAIGHIKLIRANAQKLKENE